MPTDPNQAPDGSPGPGLPDSENSPVFRPNGLWQRPHSAPPPETRLLHPPELLRCLRETLNTTEPLPPGGASESLFAPLEGFVLEPRNTPPMQRFVLLPDPAAMSPVLLPPAGERGREAIYHVAMQGLATPWEVERPVSAFSLGPPASNLPCAIPLPQEDSAFALAEAPTPPAPAKDEPAGAEQEIAVALAGALPFFPYADH